MSASSSGGMSPEDLEICRQTLKTLTSDKYKDKNYLFLHPFDLNQTPGYMDVVSKVMDLSTVSKQLESGTVYKTRKQFFQDVTMVFENAIAYHGTREQSKWIVKPAKDMLKICQRAERNAEKKLERSASIGSTTTSTGERSFGMKLPTKKNKRLSLDSVTSTGSKKEGTKLKLKLGAKGMDPSASSSAGGSSSPKPTTPSSVSSSATKSSKLSIKLKSPSSSSAAPGSASASAGKQPPPQMTTSSSQPTEKKKKGLKLTLKLGKAKSSSSIGQQSPKSSPKTSPKYSSKASASSSSSTPAAVSSDPGIETSNKSSSQPSSSGNNSNNNNNDNSSGKISIKLPAGSRGKELPKGVVAPTTSKSASKKSASKKSVASSSSSTTSKGKSGTSKIRQKKEDVGESSTTPTSASKQSSKKSDGSSKSSAIKMEASDSPKGTDNPKESGKGKDPTTTTSSSSKSSATKEGKSTKSSTSPKSGGKSSTKKSSTKEGKNSTKKSKASTGSTTPTASSSSAAGSASAANRGMMFMTPARKVQCQKVLSGMKRRKAQKIKWFLHPVADKGIIQSYRQKIKHPMDVTTIQTKLDKNEYPTISAFVLDLRRIFANCLRFNTSIKDTLRPIAVEVLSTAEEIMTFFLAKPEHPTVVYPQLLFCWKLCLSVLDTLYNLTNPDDGQPTAYYFLHPVSVYCGGQFPPDYLAKVSKPMDFGTVTRNLIEGNYSTTDEFATDCKLVIENCMAYYGDGREDGKVFVEQANRLKDVLAQQLEALHRYLKSPAGEQLKSKSVSAVTTKTLPKPPNAMLLAILEELRALKYTDKGTKITEPAMSHFEKPVSTVAYPDYEKYVQTPMDLQTVESKARGDSYDTPEDFEYDMILIFQNSIAYNAANKSDHLVAMSKYGMKQFRKLFSAKMRSFDDPTMSSTSPQPAKESLSTTSKDSRSASPAAGQQSPSKRIKVESSAASSGSGVSRGKGAPRISLTAAQLSSATEKVPSTSATSSSSTSGRSKPSKSSGSKLLAKASNNNNNNSSGSSSNAAAKSNQPVPLHIAIARVKEAFPLRRAVKSLQSWEASCARFFKELMRHSWISAARPKFIFHVPVPVLFPELREAYAAKITKPMDLTTVECTLLAGNRYTGPEDFVNDVALVFSNAIAFNKDGRDVGDPLSCAYYDASIHLLRYCRWLSLELLSEHIDMQDEVAEKPEDESLPCLTYWKLSAGNRKAAREEMGAIVLKEPIEKSLEGDRYTWMEAECEKLLKALRHQSDLRYMTFFIQPNYPPDYAAFIAKPMDWERCQRTLKKRQYDKFGDIIEDLRLIFSNALKYNARHEGTDTVSGRAFEAAKYMSTKLETAINKMMLSVSDRLERESIDHNNAEREIEAAERAEEERIRAQWKSENSKDGAGGENSGTSGGGDASGMGSSFLSSRSDGGSTSGKIVRASTKRHQMRKRLNTDFEVPFFDEEDDGQHERSYFEVVRQQKAMFERQRQDRSKMQQTAVALGAAVFARMSQQELAMKWLLDEASKKRKSSAVNTASPAPSAKKQRVADSQSKIGSTLSDSNGSTSVGPSQQFSDAGQPHSEKNVVPSSILSMLGESGKGGILQIKLAPIKGKKSKLMQGTKRKRSSPISLE